MDDRKLRPNFVQLQVDEAKAAANPMDNLIAEIEALIGEAIKEEDLAWGYDSLDAGRHRGRQEAFREAISLIRHHQQAQPTPQGDEELDALKRFKAYVHKRLDDAGIPTHPEGEHSQHGCRIGDRLDIALHPQPSPPSGEIASELRKFVTLIEEAAASDDGTHIKVPAGRALILAEQGRAALHPETQGDAV